MPSRPHEQQAMEEYFSQITTSTVPTTTTTNVLSLLQNPPYTMNTEISGGLSLPSPSSQPNTQQSNNKVQFPPSNSLSVASNNSSLLSLTQKRPSTSLPSPILPRERRTSCFETMVLTPSPRPLQLSAQWESLPEEVRSSIECLAEDLRTSGLAGSRRSNLIQHNKNVMTGADIVNWLLATERAPNREEALQTGQLLVVGNLIHSIPEAKDFEDSSSLLFRLTDTERNQSPSVRSLLSDPEHTLAYGWLTIRRKGRHFALKKLFCVLHTSSTRAIIYQFATETSSEPQGFLKLCRKPVPFQVRFSRPSKNKFGFLLIVTGPDNKRITLKATSPSLTSQQIWVHALVSAGATYFEDSKTAVTEAKNIYEFSVFTRTKKPICMDIYKDTVVLITNFSCKAKEATKKMTQLQNLFNRYQQKGIRICAFPCSLFCGEADSDSDIQTMIDELGITFEILDSVQINGADACPLFVYLRNALKDQSPHGVFVANNFELFLIDKNGIPSLRYMSSTSPTALAADIERLIANKQPEIPGTVRQRSSALVLRDFGTSPLRRNPKKSASAHGYGYGSSDQLLRQQLERQPASYHGWLNTSTREPYSNQFYGPQYSAAMKSNNVSLPYTGGPVTSRTRGPVSVDGTMSPPTPHTPHSGSQQKRSPLRLLNSSSMPDMHVTNLSPLKSATNFHQSLWSNYVSNHDRSNQEQSHTGVTVNHFQFPVTPLKDLDIPLRNDKLLIKQDLKSETHQAKQSQPNFQPTVAISHRTPRPSLPTQDAFHHQPSTQLLAKRTASGPALLVRSPQLDQQTVQMLASYDSEEFGSSSEDDMLADVDTINLTADTANNTDLPSMGHHRSSANDIENQSSANNHRKRPSASVSTIRQIYASKQRSKPNVITKTIIQPREAVKRSTITQKDNQFTTQSSSHSEPGTFVPLKRSKASLKLNSDISESQKSSLTMLKDLYPKDSGFLSERNSVGDQKSLLTKDDSAVDVNSRQASKFSFGQPSGSSIFDILQRRKSSTPSSKRPSSDIQSPLAVMQIPTIQEGKVSSNMQLRHEKYGNQLYITENPHELPLTHEKLKLPEYTSTVVGILPRKQPLAFHTNTAPSTTKQTVLGPTEKPTFDTSTSKKALNMTLPADLNQSSLNNRSVLNSSRLIRTSLNASRASMRSFMRHGVSTRSTFV